MYVAVEGIIGAGKTTLAKAISERMGWRMLEEPVVDNPLLPLFYQDQKKWAFALQIRMLHSRYRMQQVAANDTTMCVLDRSLPGDRVFAALHTKYGNMHDAEWETYEHCYQAMSAVRPPMLLIYLRVSPEVAHARMRKRARNMEAGVELSYLRDLAAEYDALIDQIVRGRHAWSRGIEVVPVLWNQDLAREDYGAAVDFLLPTLERAGDST